MTGVLEMWKSAVDRKSQVPACQYLGEEIGKVGWGQIIKCLEAWIDSSGGKEPLYISEPFRNIIIRYIIGNYIRVI